MRKALLVVAVLLAGCGGTEKAAPEPAAPDRTAALKATGDSLSTTLRKAARVLDRESCADESKIRGLSTDVTHDVQTLARLKDAPELASQRPQIVNAVATATRVRDGLEELLVAC